MKLYISIRQVKLEQRKDALIPVRESLQHAGK